MTTQTIVFLYILGLATIGLLIYLLIKISANQKNQASQNIDELFQNLKNDIFRSSDAGKNDLLLQINYLREQLGQGIQHSHSSIQKQFEQSAQIIQEVTNRLTELDRTNKQVLDFSSQLQNLQNILKNPKQRGVLGEYWLETLLRNVLPQESYKMQYKIGIDEKTQQALIADAAIFIRDQIIPIDAKFSLENYNRMMETQDEVEREKIEKIFKADVKRRIDETSKYIQQEKGTMNFAFMFIPAEGIYYNLLNAEIGTGINSNNLVEYAFSKHVMLVSPTSFYAYLQTVLLGLRELQLEKSTQEILKRVSELGKHMKSYSDYHEKLGKNLSTTVNQYNLASGELKKMGKDVSRITSGETEIIIELDDIPKTLVE